MSKTVIDVSEFQGTIDWAKVKGKVDGAIIRAGFRGWGSGKCTKDSKFDANLSGVKKNAIPYGVYFLSQAVNEKEAREEADYVCNLLKSCTLSYPIYIDCESSGAANNGGRADKLSKATRTVVANAFCSQVNKNGFIGGVYSSTSWFQSKLDYAALKKYSIWAAQYGVNDGTPSAKPSIAYDGWQYTSVGKVNGINGSVDFSLFEKTLSTTKPASTTPNPTPKTDTKQTETVYTVKSGDTLSGIAAKYGTTYQKLAEYNSIANPNLIYAGQKIRIPGVAAKPAASTAKVKVGQKVKIKNGAKQYGKTDGFASFVYSTTYEVIEVSGDRVVFGLKGVVTGVTALSNIIA